MLCVVELTDVMFSCKLLIVFVGKSMVTPVPSLFSVAVGMLNNDGTGVTIVFVGKSMVTPVPSLFSMPPATLLPSLNWMLPPIIWSFRLGRSYSTTRLMVCGLVHVNFNQLPAPLAMVAHSAVVLLGYPPTTPSFALSAV